MKTLWKGVLPAEVELHQPVIAGGINFEQEVGKDYVLFVGRFTPERPLLPAVPGDVTSGFVAIAGLQEASLLPTIRLF